MIADRRHPTHDRPGDSHPRRLRFARRSFILAVGLNLYGFVPF